jgi:biotin carboxyl carrier protein
VTFEVQINGRLRTVAIESLGAVGRDGGRFRVVVHDADEPGDASPAQSRGDVTPAAVHEIDVRRTDLGLSLVFAEGARSVDAALTPQTAGEWLVQLPQVTLTALVDGRRYRRGPAGRAAAAGEQRITAPMPGRVVRVLVHAGDEVAARQGLVVVEAMKMENELTSPKAGRVKEVAVAEGTSVEAGRLLVVIE